MTSKPSDEEVAWALSVADATRRFKLLDYRPYPKQRLFHELGKTKRERCIIAGNQNGKTYCGAAEVAMHATGLYPEDWPGLRLEPPIRIWVAGITNQQTRDTAQHTLFGPMDELGTGMIPAHTIIEEPTMAKGITDFIDTALIRHCSGAKTMLQFKSYEQGRKKWQGPGVHLLWVDEEPPEEIYSEGLARTTATGGSVMMTFTPLLGMTEVVRYFYPKPNSDQRAFVQMTLDDAEHIPAERRAAEIAKYKEHERDARVRGIPMLGSGRVFPVAEALVRCEPFKLPDHYRLIAGLDFGWDHPAAVAWLAQDPDTDVVYVYDGWRMAERTREEIALVITSRANGRWVPVAWPHDGHHHDRGTGLEEAKLYERAGVRMLPEHASQANGRIHIEPGIGDMLDRMRRGKLKVFSTLEEPFFDEFRQYHRKDGKIVQVHDDFLSAVRYGLTCLPMARSKYEERPIARRAGMDYEPAEWGEPRREREPLRHTVRLQ